MPKISVSIALNNDLAPVWSSMMHCASDARGQIEPQVDWPIWNCWRETIRHLPTGRPPYTGQYNVHLNVQVSITFPRLSKTHPYCITPTCRGASYKEETTVVWENQPPPTLEFESVSDELQRRRSPVMGPKIFCDLKISPAAPGSTVKTAPVFAAKMFLPINRLSANRCSEWPWKAPCHSLWLVGQPP